jgi:metal-responsive CopG/Arc/MetJ family transcriptional regulator
MVKNRVQITLDREVLKKLKEESDRTGVSGSFIIEQLLRKYFKMGYVLRE